MSIVLGVYPVIQVLVLSSLMVMQANLALHAITITLSTVAYFVVAFTNPGYYDGEKHNPPSIDDSIRKEELVVQHPVIKEMDQEDECEKSQVVNQNIDVQPGRQQPQQNNQSAFDQQGQPPQNQILHTDNIHLTFKPQNTHTNQSPKVLKPKPKIPSPEQLQRLTNAKSDHIEFLLKQSSKQIAHRYCRICKAFQPNRVRHCHECEKCICTFDHHCPWMNNCIGQKNRNLFWTYLLLQFVQFLLVLIDVGTKAKSVVLNEGRVYFFVGAVLFVTLVAFSLLVFHTYLMLKNFTTWEFVRWDRINYLAIYIYKKSSPFSYGFMKNLSDYFFPGKTPKQWTINPQFLKLNTELQQKMKSSKSDRSIQKMPNLKSKISQRAQTQRAIIPKHKS